MILIEKKKLIVRKKKFNYTFNNSVYIKLKSLLLCIILNI